MAAETVSELGSHSVGNLGGGKRWRMNANQPDEQMDFDLRKFFALFRAGVPLRNVEFAMSV